MTTDLQQSRRPAPTLEAVAAEAGVSRSTVSRVVNGSSHVSPDVVASVKSAIDRLQYRPNRAARSLAARRTMAIALVIPEDASRFFGDPFFAPIVQGISAGLEQSEYVLNLQLVSPQAPTEKTTGYLLGGNVDGAIVVSHHSGDAFFTTLDSTLPVVFGGRPFDPAMQDANFVDVDNAAGGEIATKHLIGLGRRRIATITGPANMQAPLDRALGWSRALREAGMPDDLSEPGDFTRGSGADAMRRLLERDPGLDAVFVASDLMAGGAVDVLRAAGRRIPEDVAVVGFDDSSAAVTGPVQLTTVHQPSREMGEAMARMLLALLDDEDAPAERQRIMQTRLVVRDSA